MDLRRALLLTLATTPISGCYLHCLNIPEERFEIAGVFGAEEVDKLVRDYAVAGPENLSCTILCQHVYERERGWQADVVETCNFELPRLGENDEPPSEGQVACTGLGVQYYCKGRRPLGHVEQPARGDSFADTLAAMAELEAASIVAFEQLAEQLARLRAPAGLIERCYAAAKDERNHARWLTSLAQRHGRRVSAPKLEAHADDRLTIALHNAVEGCVHEAFAALVAAVIARRSPSSVLRGVYERIAEDEAGHGQLAWDLHAWLRERLEAEERERVDAAQRDGLLGLAGRVSWLAALPREFGPPSPGEARRLAANFVEALAA